MAVRTFEELSTTQQEGVRDALLALKHIKPEELYEYPYTVTQSRNLDNECVATFNIIAKLLNMETQTSHENTTSSAHKDKNVAEYAQKTDEVVFVLPQMPVNNYALDYFNSLNLPTGVSRIVFDCHDCYSFSTNFYQELVKCAVLLGVKEIVFSVVGEQFVDLVIPQLYSMEMLKDSFISLDIEKNTGMKTCTIKV